MSASSPPPDPRPPRRRRSWRVLLLGLFGVLALVLPLTQVLRFQVDALADARAERARLDPLAEAVAVQRGLIGHDELAARVLQGRAQLEGQRRQRQAEVDRHVALLYGTLWAGDWQRARREAAGLQDDWRRLAGDIAARRIDVAASRQGHRLLQEQAVQVMDLVQALLPWAPRGDGVAARQAAIDARVATLDHQIDQARQAIVLLAAALAVPATAVLAALSMAAARWRRRRAHASSTDDSDDVRRSHGRRAGDRAPVTTPAALAAAELDALRRAAEDERSGG
jgi:hypothetical protein